MDLSDLESKIPLARLDERWNDLHILLEDYGQIFELAAGDASVSQQNSIAREKKSFYWICVSEVSFFLNGDLNAAIDGLRRASAFHGEMFELKTAAARILLVAFQSTISKVYGEKVQVHPSTHWRTLQFIAEGLKLETILGDRISTLSPDLLLQLTLIIDSCSTLERQALLSVLASFPVVECLQIIQELTPKLTQIKDHDISTQRCTLVIGVANYFLLATDLTVVLNDYRNGTVSAYKYWLYLDTLNTKAILLDYLNDTNQALFLTQHIISHITMEELVNIPEACVYQTLLAVTKLPFLKIKVGLVSECWQAFQNCIGVSGTWRVYIPGHVLVSLTVKAALIFLDLAEIRTVTNPHTLPDEFLQAFTLLKGCYGLLHEDERLLLEVKSSSLLHRRAFEPSHMSMINFTPTSDTHTTYTIGILGILIAAITSFVDEKYHFKLPLSDNETEFTVCNYTYQMEIKPSVLLQYNFANAYLRVDNVIEAMVMLKHCHEDIILHLHAIIKQRKSTLAASKNTPHNMSSLTLNIPIEALLDTNVSSNLRIAATLETLHFTPQCILFPWLPIAKYSEIILQMNDKGMFQPAIEVLLVAIFEFFGSEATHSLAMAGYTDGKLQSTLINVQESKNVVKFLEDGLQDRYQFDLQQQQAAAAAAAAAVVWPYEDHTALGYATLILQLVRLQMMLIDREITLSEKEIFTMQSINARLLQQVHSLLESQLTNESSELYSHFVEVKALAALLYGITLSQLRLPEQALAFIKSCLTAKWKAQCKNWPPLEIRFTHLLALLITSGDDEPNKLAVAVSMLQKSITSQSSSNELLNERYTLIQLVAATGEKRLTMTMIETLFTDIRACIQHSFIAADGAVSTTKYLPGLFPEVNHKRHTKRSLVTILRGIARICIRLNKLTLAKQCLGEAWQLLYAIDPAVSARLENIARNTPEASTMKNNHEALDALKYVPTLLGWRLPEGYGWAAPHELDFEADILTECGLILQTESDVIDEHQAVEIFHLAHSHCPLHVPTMNALANVFFAKFEKEMVRLKPHELAGKGRSSGNQKSEEEKVPGTSSSAGAAAMFGIDPVSIDINLQEQDTTTTQSTFNQYASNRECSSQNLAMAHYFARLALGRRERDPDAWQLFGAVMGVLHKYKAQLNAAVTALECQQNLPHRPASIVLL